MISSLCAPTPELACFGCCPPIRPSHYDPLDYVGSLRREFAENRRSFLKAPPRYRPIVGYSCWALGFLDASGRRIGCLLHPFQNDGRDLRGLVDYGNKCSRESCLPSRRFAALPEPARRFWLPLAEGLNAFYFSSPRANPLFHLLLWGPRVLEPLRHLAQIHEGWTATELLCEAPFLLDRRWNPQAHRFLFRLALEREPLSPLALQTVEARCLALQHAVGRLPESRDLLHAKARGEYTHTLPLEDDSLDFIRLGLGLPRVPLESAQQLIKAVEAL